MGQGLNAAFNTIKLAFANDESMSSNRLEGISLIQGDWLPFVPAVRPFLQFKSLDDVSLKRETIPLSDIEYVTDRIIKVYVPPGCSDRRWTQQVYVVRIQRPTKKSSRTSFKSTKTWDPLAKPIGPKFEI
jgi:hypothetical protein